MRSPCRPPVTRLLSATGPLPKSEVQPGGEAAGPVPRAGEAPSSLLLSPVGIRVPARRRGPYLGLPPASHTKGYMWLSGPAARRRPVRIPAAGPGGRLHREGGQRGRSCAGSQQVEGGGAAAGAGRIQALCPAPSVPSTPPASGSGPGLTALGLLPGTLPRERGGPSRRAVQAASEHKPRPQRAQPLGGTRMLTRRPQSGREAGEDPRVRAVCLPGSESPRGSRTELWLAPWQGLRGPRRAGSPG